MQPDVRTEEAMEDGVIASEEYLEETVEVEPGGTLYVDVDRGAITVETHDASAVRIEASGRGWASGMCVFTLIRSGRDIHLDGDIDGWFPAFFGGARMQIRALVPRRYSVEIQTRGGPVRVEEVGGRVGAQTSGSSIEVRRIDGPALLRTSGGRITAEEVNGDVRARTSGGRIEVAYANGDVEARTSGGRIAVHGAAGSIDARTSGGKIFASWVEDPSGRLETSGGQIEVVFPEESCVDLDARTSGGKVDIEHAMDRTRRNKSNQVVGTINGGGFPLRLRTSGSKIRVRAA
jgi:hypothetical protein